MAKLQDKATAYYRQLVMSCNGGESTRPELAHAREFTRAGAKKRKSAGSARPTSQVPAAFPPLQPFDFIGVFDVASDRNTHRDTSYFHARALQLLRQIDRCGFTFDRGIGGKNHFVDISRLHARDQIRNSELLRSHPVKRGYCAVQNVEDSI